MPGMPPSFAAGAIQSLLWMRISGLLNVITGRESIPKTKAGSMHRLTQAGMWFRVSQDDPSLSARECVFSVFEIGLNICQDRSHDNRTWGCHALKPIQRRASKSEPDASPSVRRAQREHSKRCKYHCERKSRWTPARCYRGKSRNGDHRT